MLLFLFLHDLSMFGLEDLVVNLVIFLMEKFNKKARYPLIALIEQFFRSLYVLELGAHLVICIS